MKIRTMLLGLVFSMIFVVQTSASQAPDTEPSASDPKLNERWVFWLMQGLPEEGSAVAGDENVRQEVKRLTENAVQTICGRQASSRDCVSYLKLAIKVKNACFAPERLTDCSTAIAMADQFVKLAGIKAASPLPSPRGGGSPRAEESTGQGKPTFVMGKRSKKDVTLEPVQTRGRSGAAPPLVKKKTND